MVEAAKLVNQELQLVVFRLGVGKMENRLLILLKLDKILGAEKLNSIQKISAEKKPPAS